MQVTINKAIKIYNGNLPKKDVLKEKSLILLKPGKHKVVEIPNPYDPDGFPWIVLKGTKHGMRKDIWIAEGAVFEE